MKKLLDWSKLDEDDRDKLILTELGRWFPDEATRTHGACCYCLRCGNDKDYCMCYIGTENEYAFDWLFPEILKIDEDMMLGRDFTMFRRDWDTLDSSMYLEKYCEGIGWADVIGHTYLKLKGIVD